MQIVFCSKLCQTKKQWLICICICFCSQGAAKALIFPVVQQFTEAFVQALQMPDGPSSDSGLKMEVLKVNISLEQIVHLQEPQ